jgi:hypothetical protein
LERNSARERVKQADGKRGSSIDREGVHTKNRNRHGSLKREKMKCELRRQIKQTLRVGERGKREKK